MAEVLFNSGHYRGARFHAQQAVEKALKGMLLHVGWELERTHSLRKLAAIGKRYGVGEILSEDDVVYNQPEEWDQRTRIAAGAGPWQL